MSPAKSTIKGTQKWMSFRIGDHHLRDWSFSSRLDRKSTRLNSSHSQISYAVFCLKKKKTNHSPPITTILLSTSPIESSRCTPMNHLVVQRNRVNFGSTLTPLTHGTCATIHL